MQREKSGTKVIHKGKETHAPTTSVAVPLGGVVIGRLVGFDDQGAALVAYDFSTLHEPLSALSVVPLGEQQIGQDVAISFASNREGVALILGVIHTPAIVPPEAGTDADEAAGAYSGEFSPGESSPGESLLGESSPTLEIDGQSLRLSGQKEITLRCGKSSITLTKSGKILIKGEHIVSRATGSNRILGGAIQLN